MNRRNQIWRAIRGWRLWQYVTTVRALVAGLLVVDVLFILREYGVDLETLKEHLFDNVATDVLSIGLAILVIDVLNERRAVRNEKRMLIEQMGSPANDAALEAVRRLRSRGWLTDGSLRGMNLDGANLEGAYLEDADFQGAHLHAASFQGAHLHAANLQGADLNAANLQGTHLDDANLQEAYLMGANLQGADMRVANLQEADLEFANLQGADMRVAKLQGAILWDANLQGTDLWFAKLQEASLGSANLQKANLREANLREADLGDAEFDRKTILPDGSKWTPDVEIARFTDSDHPDFWCSGDPESPAYWGEEDKTRKGR